MRLCVCSIHPRYKHDVAFRLLLGAQAIAYEKSEVSFQGPFPRAVLIKPSYLNVTFNQRITATLSNDTFEVMFEHYDILVTNTCSK